MCADGAQCAVGWKRIRSASDPRCGQRCRPCAAIAGRRCLCGREPRHGRNARDHAVAFIETERWHVAGGIARTRAWQRASPASPYACIARLLELATMSRSLFVRSGLQPLSTASAFRAGVRNQPTPRNRTTRIATTDGQPVEKGVATSVTLVQETMTTASIRQVSPVCGAACAAARRSRSARPGRCRSRSIPWRSALR